MGSKFQSLELGAHTLFESKTLDYITATGKYLSSELQRRDIYKCVINLTEFIIGADSVRADALDNAHCRRAANQFELNHNSVSLDVVVTRVRHETSIIPLVKINDWVLSTEVFKQISGLVKRVLPENLRVSSAPGSIYVICAFGKTGALWNIHKDRIKFKIHIPISDCEDEIAWYDNEHGENMLDVLKFKKDRAYILAVDSYHTAIVTRFVENTPRIHIVADLEEC